jgi:hypothetical protein
MRSISGALQAKQVAPSGIPTVAIEVHELTRSARHFQFVQTVSGGDPDDKHDAAGDATYLHQARVTSGRVQYKRTGGAFADLGGGTDSNEVAIHAINNTRVIVVYNRVTSIMFRESTDQGTSFGVETTILTGVPTTQGIAVQYTTTGGDLCIVYEQSNALRRIKRTSGTFGSPAAWSNSMTSINSVGMVFAGDFHVVLTGVKTDARAAVLTVTLGNGFAQTLDTWSALLNLITAETDSGITFQAAKINALDRHHILYVEKRASAPAYTRTYHTWFPASFAFAANAWVTPIPLNNTTAYGYAITITGSGASDKAVLARPAQVLEAAFDAPAATVLTADLIEAHWSESLRDHKGRFVFDNNDGRYKDVPALIAVGHNLHVAIGYDGDTSPGPRETIVNWEHDHKGGDSRFVIHTRGADFWLDNARPRTSRTFSGLTIGQLIQDALGTAGLELVDIGGSSRITSFILEWALHPHQSAGDNLDALMNLVPDIIRHTAEFAYLFEPLATDAAAYDYTTQGHTIYTSKLRREQRVSVAEIINAAALGQAFDFTEQAQDSPIQDRRLDPHTAVVADLNAHAAARIRKAILNQDHGHIVAPPHCGLEAGDVIAFDDAVAATGEIKRRVRQLDFNFRRGRRGKPAKFEQTVHLGGV